MATAVTTPGKQGHNRVVSPALPALRGLRQVLWRRWQAARQRRNGLRLANLRAERLLAASLSDEEYAQYRRNWYVDVPSPYYTGRVYRIPRRSGPVAVREHGMTVQYLRAWPEEPLPDAALVLARKLQLEGDEARYLRAARHEPAVFIPWHWC
ncbi:MAG TPA: hypothetical protein VFU78_03965 [Thermomicrobiales bacterium]|nr:hypothetical protein [Thermomicrobiales bacterium]